MAIAKVSFNESRGKIKPMHAVNNGPVYKFATDQRVTNIDAFIDAGIPYARNHDAAFYSTYGGEHTVDVHNIFTNFDKDPYDPASYDFAMTDEYIRVCEYADVRTFYRLGSKIEHGIKKYGTLPPKDFYKWAVICEHIIRHYTEGWADGFNYNIEYWEIWNEPDLDRDDAINKRTWGGTRAEFFEFYHVVATHLKKNFPHLKIGGPALSHRVDWTEEFLAQLKAPLDFFSWHFYGTDTEKLIKKVKLFRELLDKYGFSKTESILNEWNYVKSFAGEDWIYSLKCDKNIKGASYVAAVMEECQYAPLDILMYYDARPCGMNGMFSSDLVCNKLKGYYPFLMFGTLYRLDHAVKAVSDNEDIHICAAMSDIEAALMITHYSDNDEKGSVEVSIDLQGFGTNSGSELEYYLLDADHDLELAGKATYFGNRFILTLNMPNFTSYLIKIKNTKH